TTPDAMSTFLILLGFYLIYRQADTGWIIGVFILSALFRPENILWLIAVGIFHSDLVTKRWMLILGISGLGVLGLLSYRVMAAAPGYFSVSGYLESILNYLKHVRYSPLLIIYPLVGYLLWNNAYAEVWKKIFRAILLFGILRALIHPSYEDRFFVFAGIIGILFIAECLSRPRTIREDRPTSLRPQV
ncbi:MAG: hypothetical protein KDC57_10110, partial [Saprospiraceae bacterium]|nr:hypothetical protein [Saprospiraceae bacterium]